MWIFKSKRDKRIEKLLDRAMCVLAESERLLARLEALHEPDLYAPEMDITNTVERTVVNPVKVPMFGIPLNRSPLSPVTMS